MQVESKSIREVADSLTVSAVRLTRWLKAADPAPRLTGAQASALAVVVYSGGIRPSDLAALEEVKRPTMARTIGELTALGFVERAPGEGGDGRSVLIQATTLGRRVLAEGQARRIEPLAASLATLPDVDVQTLVEAVAVLERVLEKAAGRGA